MRRPNIHRTPTMFNTTRRLTLPCLALAALLSAGHAMAATSMFALTGSTDSVGPLPDLAFHGQFAHDASAATAGFTGEIALSSFTLHFAGQVYSLGSADAGSLPVAAYAGGQFLGVAYVDADAIDSSARPHLALVPGFFSLADSQLAYELAGQGGYGSYSISAVPEPASLALLLAGLGVVGAACRARRNPA